MKISIAEHFIINLASKHAIISHKHLENDQIKLHLWFVSSICIFLNKIICLQRVVVKIYFRYTCALVRVRASSQEAFNKNEQFSTHGIYVFNPQALEAITSLRLSFIEDKISPCLFYKEKEQTVKLMGTSLVSTFHPRNSFSHWPNNNYKSKSSIWNLPMQFKPKYFMDKIFSVNYT